MRVTLPTIFLEYCSELASDAGVGLRFEDNSEGGGLAVFWTAGSALGALKSSDDVVELVDALSGIVVIMTCRSKASGATSISCCRVFDLRREISDSCFRGFEESADLARSVKNDLETSFDLCGNAFDLMGLLSDEAFRVCGLKRQVLGLMVRLLIAEIVAQRRCVLFKAMLDCQESV